MKWKQQLAALTAAMMTAGCLAAPAGASAQGEWADAYREVIAAANAELPAANEPGWNLADLNADGTPELLISEGFYHVAGVRIYWFNGQRAVPVDQDGDGKADVFGGFGTIAYAPEQQLVRDGYSSTGYTIINYRRFHGSGFTTVQHFEDDLANGSASTVCMIDGNAVSESDYSSRLSEYNALNWIVLDGLYALSDTTALKETAFADSWRTPYKQILLTLGRGSDSDDLNLVKYSVADILGDARPELIVGMGGYHMASADVYTMQGNVPVKLGSFGEYGEMGYDASTGELISSYMGMGYYSEMRMKYQNGELVATISYSDNEGSGDTPVYYRINGVDVSKEQYDAQKAVYANHLIWSFGRDYEYDNFMPIDAYTFPLPETAPGDVNGDGTINAADASELLIAAADIGAGNTARLTAELLGVGDVNSDGAINAADATAILQYSAAVGAGNAGASIWDYA